MRTATSLFRKSTPSSRQQTQRFQQRERCCPLCKQAGRTEFRHFLSSCRFLPENDRKFMTKLLALSTMSKQMMLISLKQLVVMMLIPLIARRILHSGSRFVSHPM